MQQFVQKCNWEAANGLKLRIVLSLILFADFGISIAWKTERMRQSRIRSKSKEVYGMYG